jgi:hypothetical protein
MQASASSNQILLSAAVYMEVASHVQAHPREPLRLKGKTMPLQAHELDGLCE